MLAELCEEILLVLNTNSTLFPGWGIDIALDPMDLFEERKKNIWVVPVMLQYSLNESSTRGKKILSVWSQPIVTVCMSCSYTTFKVNDVATWQEAKTLLNLRETIDKLMFGTEFSQQITDVISEPPQEILQEQKWFLSITEFTFGGMKCV